MRTLSYVRRKQRARLYIAFGVIVILLFYMFSPSSKEPEEIPQLPPKECPTTVFTWAQVKEHSCDMKTGEFNLWLVMRGNVYDVSRFVPEHPGSTFICSGAGIDATNKFENEIGHSDYAKNLREQFCIGRIEREENTKQDAV